MRARQTAKSQAKTSFITFRCKYYSYAEIRQIRPKILPAPFSAGFARNGRIPDLPEPQPV